VANLEQEGARAKRESPLITKLTPLDIDPDNLWRDDQLDRKYIAEKLIPVIDGSTQTLTLGLDGGYGNGKSFFLQRLRRMLQQSGHRVVYIDAWANDFSGDPMSAFIAAMGTQLAREPGQALATRLRDLTRVAAPLLIKAAARKLLGDESVKDLLEATGGDYEKLSEALGDAAKKRIEAYEQTERSVAGFKKRLSEIALEDESGKGRRGLIVLVDELDRSRPTFAIETLEHIKHFFSVDGVVFVVAIDRKQLEAKRYLKKAGPG